MHVLQGFFRSHFTFLCWQNIHARPLDCLGTAAGAVGPVSGLTGGSRAGGDSVSLLIARIDIA